MAPIVERRVVAGPDAEPPAPAAREKQQQGAGAGQVGGHLVGRQHAQPGKAGAVAADGDQR